MYLKVLIAFCFLASLLGSSVGKPSFGWTLMCPVDWVGPTTTGKCYRLMPERATPLSAKILCVENGGTLGSIKDQVEQDFVVTNLLPNATDYFVVTGLEKIPADNGTWTWPDGATTSGDPNATDVYQNWVVDDLSPGYTNYMYLNSPLDDHNSSSYGQWWPGVAMPYEVLCETSPKVQGHGHKWHWWWWMN